MYVFESEIQCPFLLPFQRATSYSISIHLDLKFWKNVTIPKIIALMIWELNQWEVIMQMSLLFDKDSDTIGLHLKNIFKSEELVEISTAKKYSVVQQEGNREIKRNILHYKLYPLKAVEILNKINQKPSNLSTKGLWNKVQYTDKK